MFFVERYGVNILLSALLIAFTLGSFGVEGRGFLADIRQAGLGRIICAGA